MKELVTSSESYRKLLLLSQIIACVLELGCNIVTRLACRDDNAEISLRAALFIVTALLTS